LFSDIDLRFEEVPETGETDLLISVATNQPTRISRVVIKSRSLDASKQIQELLKIRAGDIFNKQVLEDEIEKINRYLKTNQFTTSKVEDVSLQFTDNQTKVEIIVTVLLKEKYQFEILGNTVFSDVQLREFFNEEILSQTDAPQKIAQAIETKYQSIGYHFCKVSIENLPEDQGRLVRIRLRINEGKKVYIDRIEFAKIRDANEGDMRKLFFKSATGVVARGVYSTVGVQEAARNLQKHLEATGYREASVGIRKVVFTEDEKGAIIYLDAETGVQTYISSINFFGNHRISKSKLEEVITFKAEEPFNRERIEESRNKIVEYYQSQGFLDAKLKEDKKTIAL